MPLIDYRGTRVLFVHVPKTGGSSVETWMRGLAPLQFASSGVPDGCKVTPTHYTWNDLSAHLPPETVDYAFMLVRNPFARIASEYRMRWLVSRDNHFSLPAFAPWLERAMAAYRREATHLDNHIRPQWHFASRRVRIFRLEDGLSAALRTVAREAGLPPPDGPPPRERRTAAFGGTLDWDLGEMERVRELYGIDFERFGYPLEFPKRGTPFNRPPKPARAPERAGGKAAPEPANPGAAPGPDPADPAG